MKDVADNLSSPRVTGELLPVTQEDRDAAAQAYHAIAKGYMQVIGCAMEAGAADHAELVQLFARHRQSHTTDGHSTAGEEGDHFVKQRVQRAYEQSLSPPHTSDTAGDWRDIASAPKDGTRILVRFGEVMGWRVDAARWIANLRRPGGYFSSHIVEHVQGERYMRGNQPTHWMPMPSATLSQHTSDSALREVIKAAKHVCGPGQASRHSVGKLRAALDAMGGDRG